MIGIPLSLFIKVSEIQRINSLREKWAKTGLLDGINGMISDELTKLYECNPRYLNNKDWSWNMGKQKLPIDKSK